MINLALSLAATAAAFALFFLLGFPAVGAMLPALIAFGAAYVLLARRSVGQLEQIGLQVQKELTNRKPDRAVELLVNALPLGRWQFLLEAQIHGQIGMLLYMQKKFEEAEPHLEKSFVKVWQARAMLAAQHFRRKDWKKMTEVFDAAARSNKNEGLLWAVWAFCEEKRGEPKRALEILTRGLAANPNDEKLKTLLGRLQNDKKMKLDQAYGEQWYQFWLETPPTLQPGGGFGGGFGLRGMRGGGRRRSR